MWYFTKKIVSTSLIYQSTYDIHINNLHKIIQEESRDFFCMSNTFELFFCYKSEKFPKAGGGKSKN